MPTMLCTQHTQLSTSTLTAPTHPHPRTCWMRSWLKPRGRMPWTVCQSSDQVLLVKMPLSAGQWYGSGNRSSGRGCSQGRQLGAHSCTACWHVWQQHGNLTLLTVFVLPWTAIVCGWHSPGGEPHLTGPAGCAGTCGSKTWGSPPAGDTQHTRHTGLYHTTSTQHARMPTQGQVSEQGL
jgi:hypothetical protein